MKKVYALSLDVELMEILSKESVKECRSLSSTVNLIIKHSIENKQELLIAKPVVQSVLVDDAGSVIEKKENGVYPKDEKHLRIISTTNAIQAKLDKPIMKNNAELNDIDIPPLTLDGEIIELQNEIENQEAIRKANHFSSQECINAIKEKNELIIQLGLKQKEKNKIERGLI